jgi:hypothetical protein
MNAAETMTLEPLDAKVARFAGMIFVVGVLGALATPAASWLWATMRLEQPAVPAATLLGSFFLTNLAHGWVLAYVVLLRRALGAPRLGGSLSWIAATMIAAGFAPLAAIKAIQLSHGGLIEDWKVWVVFATVGVLQFAALLLSRRPIRRVEAELAGV